MATFYSGRAPTAYPFLDDILELMPNNNSGQSQALGVLFKLPQLKRLLVAESSKDNIADSVHESAHNNLVKLGFSFFFIISPKYRVSGWPFLLRSNSGNHRQVKQGSEIGGTALGQLVFWVFEYTGSLL